MISKVLEVLEERQLAQITARDLSKAFDCIDFSILLNKLVGIMRCHDYNIAVNWLDALLLYVVLQQLKQWLKQLKMLVEGYLAVKGGKYSVEKKTHKHMSRQV